MNKSNRRNPYLPPMLPEAVKMLSTMPKHAGAIVSLFHVPSQALVYQERLWRDWCRNYPDRTLWPLFLEQWGAEKKRRAGKE